VLILIELYADHSGVMGRMERGQESLKGEPGRKKRW